MFYYRAMLRRARYCYGKSSVRQEDYWKRKGRKGKWRGRPTGFAPPGKFTGYATREGYTVVSIVIAIAKNRHRLSLS